MLIRSGRIPFENMSQLCAYWGISYQDPEDEEHVPQPPSQARSGSNYSPSQQQVPSSDMSASHKEKVANKTPVQCAKQTSFTATTHRSSSNKSCLNADSSHKDVTTGRLADDTTTRSAATISPPVVPPEASNAQTARETIVASRERSEPSASVVQEEHMVPGSSQGTTKEVGQACSTSDTRSATGTERSALLPEAEARSVEVTEPVRKEHGPSDTVESEANHGPCLEQLPNKSVTPKKKPKGKPKVAAAQRAKTTGPVTQGPVDNQSMEVTEASTEPMQPSVSTEPAASTTPRASQQQAMKAPPKDKSTEFKATVQVLADKPKPQGDTRAAKPAGAGQGRTVGESQTRKTSSRAGQPHSVKTQPNTRSTRFKTTPAAEADKAELKPVTRSAPKTSDPAIHSQQDANSTTNVESTGEQPEPSASGKNISSRGGQHRVDDKSASSPQRSRPNTKSKPGPKLEPKNQVTASSDPVADPAVPGESNFKEVRAPDREQPGPSVAGKKASARRSPVTKPRSNPRPARSNAKAKTDVATDGASNKSAKDSATKTKNPPTPKKAAVKLQKTDSEQPGPSSSGIHVPKSPPVYELRSKKPNVGTEAPDATVVSTAAAKPEQNKPTKCSAPVTLEPTASANRKTAPRTRQNKAAASVEAPPVVTEAASPVPAAASEVKRRVRRSNKKSQVPKSAAAQATDGPTASQSPPLSGARMLTRQRAQPKTPTKEGNVGHADAPARRPLTRKRKATTSATEVHEAPAQEPAARTRAQKAKLAAANDAKK